MQQEMESLGIQNLIKTCLSIHHGKADCERSLCDNINALTKQQTSLREEPLTDLRRCKTIFKICRRDAHQALVLRQIINKVKDALYLSF